MKKSEVRTMIREEVKKFNVGGPQGADKMAKVKKS